MPELLIETKEKVIIVTNWECLIACLGTALYIILGAVPFVQFLILSLRLFPQVWNGEPLFYRQNYFSKQMSADVT